MKPRSRLTRAARRGFTLIELLTVIAIIALLAALLFPVMAAVRENTRQAQCITNIHHMIQGVQMYKDDWGVYPEALYGVSYNGQPVQTRLFPDYVKNEQDFVCPNAPVKLTAASRQPVAGVLRMFNTATQDYQGWVPQFSSYDQQYRPRPTGSNLPEYHYRLKWTNRTGVVDEKRQLIYKNPPDSTVVTWCLYHTNMDAQGNPSRGTMAIYGFLNGRAQKIPVDRTFQDWPSPCTSVGPPNPISQCPWLVDPKQ